MTITPRLTRQPARQPQNAGLDAMAARPGGLRLLTERGGARFGQTPAQTALNAGAEAAEAQIRNLAVAERLFKTFGKMTKDIRFFNLSMEDWANRCNTLLAVYAPQAYLSIKDNKHKWETNGRNLLLWTITILLTVTVKNDRFGVNMLLDKIMQPQGSPRDVLSRKLARAEGAAASAQKAVENFTPKTGFPGGLLSARNRRKLVRQAAKQEKAITSLGQKLANTPAEAAGSLVHRVMNRFRLPYDYFSVIEKSGIKVTPADRFKAMWASLDANQIDTIQQQLEKYRGMTPDALGRLSAEQAEKAKVILETAPAFLKRMNVFRLISTGIITALTVYIIGNLMMKVVLKYIAPRDPDFDASKVKGGGKKPAQAADQAARSPEFLAKQAASPYHYASKPTSFKKPASFHRGFEHYLTGEAQPGAAAQGGHA